MGWYFLQNLAQNCVDGSLFLDNLGYVWTPFQILNQTSLPKPNFLRNSFSRLNRESPPPKKKPKLKQNKQENKVSITKRKEGGVVTHAFA